MTTHAGIVQRLTVLITCSSRRWARALPAQSSSCATATAVRWSRSASSKKARRCVHQPLASPAPQTPHLVPASRLLRYSLARPPSRPSELPSDQRAPCIAYAAARSQVTKQVEREVLNHRSLLHPHVLQFREVRHKSFRRRSVSSIRPRSPAGVAGRLRSRCFGPNLVVSSAVQRWPGPRRRLPVWGQLPADSPAIIVLDAEAMWTNANHDPDVVNANNFSVRRMRESCRQRTLATRVGAGGQLTSVKGNISGVAVSIRFCHRSQVFVTPTHLGVVTEYAREGDLRALLDKRRRLTEGKARFLLQQLVSAIAYCHCEARPINTLSSCLRPRRGDPETPPACCAASARSVMIQSPQELANPHTAP